MPAPDPYSYGNPFLNIASLDMALAASSNAEVTDGPFAIIDPSPTPEEYALQREVIPACDRYLSSLTRQQREVVDLVYWEGLSQAEAARVLGVSRAAVSQRLSNAHEIGREHLARYRDCCTFN